MRRDPMNLFSAQVRREECGGRQKSIIIRSFVSVSFLRALKSVETAALNTYVGSFICSFPGHVSFLFKFLQENILNRN